MRVLLNAPVTIGEVVVPVGVAIAQSRADEDISFRQLHRECGTPIKQQRWCPEHEAIVEEAEIAKGYEFSKDQYVVVEEDELAPFQQARILIEQTSKLGDLNLWDVDRTYWLMPAGDAPARRPYVLLAGALEETELAAIGKAVLWGKESPVCVHVREDGVLALTLLMFAGGIRSTAEAAELLGGVDLRVTEKRLAARLARAMRTPYDPAAFSNETANGIRAMLQAKAKGRGRKRAAVVRGPAAATLDLSRALQASLEDLRAPARTY